MLLRFRQAVQQHGVAADFLRVRGGLQPTQQLLLDHSPELCALLLAQQYVFSDQDAPHFDSQLLDRHAVHD